MTQVYFLTREEVSFGKNKNWPICSWNWYVHLKPIIFFLQSFFMKIVLPTPTLGPFSFIWHREYESNLGWAFIPNERGSCQWHSNVRKFGEMSERTFWMSPSVFSNDLSKCKGQIFLLYPQLSNLVLRLRLFLPCN